MMIFLGGIIIGLAVGFAIGWFVCMNQFLG